jgi:hypothetical protein
MYKCITCGAELHPERARKYNYCMKPECQEKNAKGLTMVAVGVNKSAEQYLILDEQTKEELASGKYHDQRRGSFGTSAASAPAGAPDTPATPTTPSTSASPASPATPATPAKAGQTGPAPRRPRPAEPQRPRVTREPWTKSQRRLALLYNEQGLRPDEIAQKLGLSRYLVTQIILNSRSRGKL